MLNLPARFGSLAKDVKHSQVAICRQLDVGAPKSGVCSPSMLADYHQRRLQLFHQPNSQLRKPDVQHMTI
jgi:hypothetical protein